MSLYCWCWWQKTNSGGYPFRQEDSHCGEDVAEVPPEEDISRSFKLPTPTQRRANTLTLIIDYTKSLVEDKWWPRRKHWKGKHNRRRARTREHAKRRRRMHTKLMQIPEELEGERDWERQRTEQRHLEDKNWWLSSLKAMGMLYTRRSKTMLLFHSVPPTLLRCVWKDLSDPYLQLEACDWTSAKTQIGYWALRVGNWRISNSCVQTRPNQFDVVWG